MTQKHPKTEISKNSKGHGRRTQIKRYKKQTIVRIFKILGTFLQELNG